MVVWCLHALRSLCGRLKVALLGRLLTSEAADKPACVQGLLAAGVYILLAIARSAG
jgi:hypothetical protein